MESSDPKPKDVVANVELTHPQTELLGLLRSLVQLITSDTMMDMQNLPEVRGKPPFRSVIEPDA